FLAQAAALEVLIAAGGTPEQLAVLNAKLFNQHLDVTMAALFVCLVTVIVAGCAREWIAILNGGKKAALQESDYVVLEAA
ncbi:MAG: cstA, partial [Verrucomicrobiaceae bacterium]|nr:cstA [Verrucomicrobiaceae bacterium]